MKKIIWLLVIIPIIYLAIVWNQLPEKVALHFNLKGNIDRYGSKNELLLLALLLTTLNVGIYFLLTNMYRIDPKKNAADNKSRLSRMGFAVSVFMSAILCLIIYSSIHGNIRLGIPLILSATGLLFAFMGNYMHNIKPNYFAGFRLPWTLNNDENWKKTHALGGRLWFAGGLFIAVVCLFTPPLISLIVFFTVMIVITIIPGVYSYRLYKKQKQLNILN
ncbi:MAG: SdpI family protein [Bacteroidota bacterium]